MPSPNEGGAADENHLSDVRAFSATDVWAVGDSTSNGTLTMHRDAAGWSIVPAPDVAGRQCSLAAITGVPGSSRRFAVGSCVDQATGDSRTLIERWNGTGWTIVPSPAPGVSSTLTDVVAVSGHELWAVGGVARPGTPRPDDGADDPVERSRLVGGGEPQRAAARRGDAPVRARRWCREPPRSGPWDTPGSDPPGVPGVLGVLERRPDGPSSPRLPGCRGSRSSSARSRRPGRRTSGASERGSTRTSNDCSRSPSTTPDRTHRHGRRRSDGLERRRVLRRGEFGDVARQRHDEPCTAGLAVLDVRRAAVEFGEPLHQ